MSGRYHSNNNSKADAVTMMVSFFMAVSFFIIGNIYWNSATSDLVVIKHAKMIRTYIDIMNNEPPLEPIFDPFDGATDDFEFAAPETTEGKFWKKYKVFIESTRRRGMLDLIQSDRQILLQEAVRIKSSVSLIFNRKTLCIFKNVWQDDNQRIKYAYTWVSKDPGASIKSSGFIYRTGMKQTKFFKGFLRRVRRATELGLPSKVQQWSAEGMGPSLNIKTDIDVVRKCMSDTENLNQVSVEMVVPQHLRSLFIFSLLLYLISLLIFLFEVVFKKMRTLFSRTLRWILRVTSILRRWMSCVNSLFISAGIYLWAKLARPLHRLTTFWR